MDQPACLEKMSLVQKRGHLSQRDQVSQALIGVSSHKSDNEDYENPSRSNKPAARLPETLPPEIDAIH